MTEFTNQPGVGGELGDEATAHVERRSTDYCAAERQRIELTNQPKALALRAKIAALNESVRDIEERIRLAPPPSEALPRKKKSRFYWAITILLSLAGFLFSLIAFDPFRLGWKAWLYCVGIAVVTPFLLEKLLELWANPKLVKMLTTIACISALVSLILLAVIRGDLLNEQIATPTAVAVVETRCATRADRKFILRTHVGTLEACHGASRARDGSGCWHCALRGTSMVRNRGGRKRVARKTFCIAERNDRARTRAVSP